MTLVNTEIEKQENIEYNNVLTKENLNNILNNFAKYYKKNCGNIPIEIVIVGGGSILINYDFRGITKDLDVVCRMVSGFKEAVKKTSDEMNLPDDWMNTDVKFLSSYSSKLGHISKYYRSLNNGTVNIRTVKGEYLIATKMQSGREFGNDIPDIIGILFSEKENSNDITFEQIMNAGTFLYEDKFNVTESLKNRVKLFCSLSVEELKKEYDKRVQLSDKIKSIITSEHPILVGKASAKKIAQMIEEQLGQDLE